MGTRPADQTMDGQSVRVPAVDRLTGLATTAALRARMAQLQQELGEGPDGVTFGLVLVNIRDLSAFNQTHGYEVGDELVAEVAARLARLTAPKPDVPRLTTVACIARTGGGEFVL